MTFALDRAFARRALQLILAGVFLAFVARAVSTRWSDVRDVIGQLDGGAVALSFCAAGAALWCSFMSWRTIMKTLDQPVPLLIGMWVFFVGQLGKYVPGKVWAVVAQVRLGRAYRVDAKSSAASLLIAMLLGVVTALMIPAAGLPMLRGPGLERHWWALLVLAGGLILLYPPVLNWVLDLGLRFLRRDALRVPVALSAVLRGMGWALAAWVLYGVHFWILVRDLGADESQLLLMSTVAFAASWAVGFIVSVAPAGVGPREVAIVVIMGAEVGDSIAVVAAPASRLLLTGADLTWPLIALVLTRRSGISAEKLG